ncbi:MAG: hypothetical protein ACI9F9_002011 [Candidatus Paceibacteria bacterium]
MKRFLDWLPHLGLLTLLLVAIVHSFGSEGLGFIDLPNPPKVDLSDLAYSSGTSHVIGQVLNEKQEAIAEALVWTEIEGELVWDYTDIQGSFELERIPPGAHSLSVVRRKFAREQFEVEAPGEGVVVTLTGAVSESPQLPEIEESDISGEVIAPIAGRALVHYEVQLVPVDPPSFLGAPIPVRAVIGPDRRFSFPALIHGAYSVRVLPPWAKGGSWPNLIETDSALYVHGPASKNMKLQLLAGELAGRLIDTSGEPVRGALVRATLVTDPTRPWLPVSSGNAGNFLIRDLPPGKYRLEIHAGQSGFDQEVEVFGAITSHVDVPPLLLRREKLQSRINSGG